MSDEPMSGTEDPIRAALRRLAEDVEDADLYGPALRRSRRIAHRRAAAGTVSALTVLGLACGGLWCLAPPGGHGGSPGPATLAEPAPAVGHTAPQVPPATSAAPTSRPARTIPAPRPHPTRSHIAVPRSRSLADLPGEVFYDQQGEDPKVIRLDGDGRTETVLTAPHSALGISPDGSKIAYVQDGTLLVVATGGGAPEQPYDGTVSDQQAPAWSPDGDQLLVDATDPSVLDVADGTLSALPGDLDGQHFRWSGDGRKVVFATPSCRLKVAELAVAEPVVTVPTVGDPEIPGGLGACRPVSVDETGSRVAVPLQPAGGTDDGSAEANAVIDTTTGITAVLPVSGVVVGAVFDARGWLLVRAVDQGRTTLSLFSPTDVLLVQASEPSRLSGLDLVAYTR
jgi:TolB protein